MTISYEQFLQVEMRIGRIIRAEDFPQARKPAYQVWIDFGPELGVKQSSAQITRLYTRDQLIGRLVVAVVNFEPKRIAGFRSEVLLLGTETEPDVVRLLEPGSDAIIGARVF